MNNLKWLDPKKDEPEKDVAHLVRNMYEGSPRLDIWVCYSDSDGWHDDDDDHHSSPDGYIPASDLLKLESKEKDEPDKLKEMGFDEFIKGLHEAGWEGVKDAQHAKIKVLYDGILNDVALRSLKQAHNNMAEREGG